MRKRDILIARNYLRQEEIDQLNRLTTFFLDSAELQVKERRDLMLNYWRSNVDALFQLQGKDLLLGKGAVTHKQVELQVHKVYTQFDQRHRLGSLHEGELREAQELKQLEGNIIARAKEDVSSPQHGDTSN